MGKAKTRPATSKAHVEMKMLRKLDRINQMFMPLVSEDEVHTEVLPHLLARYPPRRRTGTICLQMKVV